MASPSRVRRDRVLFYAGLVLLLLGVPGFLVGTFVHDPLEVPLVGTAYDGFGFINEIFLGLGIVLGVVGAALVALALRGGVIADEEMERGGPGA